MPVSDEEAYKQRKRIAEDIARGTFRPGKDHSDHSYRTTSDATNSSEVSGAGKLIRLFVFAPLVGLIAPGEIV